MSGARPHVRSGARRVLVVAAGVVLGCLPLAACSQSGDTLEAQAQRGDSKGFVAGDGAIEAIAPDQRAEPVRLEGTLLDGSPWKVADQRGKVVVVNVWGSWCPPCEAEMPKLEASWKALSAKHADLRFVGIDVAESAQTGAAAAARYGLGYPSLSDQNRTLTLGLQGKAAATPTTLVLDRQGRIAARVSGGLTSEATLAGLVEDVLKAS